MKTLVMVPALGCDQDLYTPLAEGLSDIVRTQTIIADRDLLEACVAQVLKAAPAKFVILGTSVVPLHSRVFPCCGTGPGTSVTPHGTFGRGTALIDCCPFWQLTTSRWPVARAVGQDLEWPDVHRRLARGVP